MITGAQITIARKLVGWSAQVLALKSKRSLATIQAVERGVASTDTLTSLQQLFEAAGVEFTDGGQPGAQMRKTDAT